MVSALHGDFELALEGVMTASGVTAGGGHTPLWAGDRVVVLRVRAVDEEIGSGAHAACTPSDHLLRSICDVCVVRCVDGKAVGQNLLFML